MKVPHRLVSEAGVAPGKFIGIFGSPSRHLSQRPMTGAGAVTTSPSPRNPATRANDRTRVNYLSSPRTHASASRATSESDLLRITAAPTAT